MGGRKITKKSHHLFLVTFLIFITWDASPKSSPKGLWESQLDACSSKNSLFVSKHTLRNSNQTIQFSIIYILVSGLEVIIHSFRVLIWVFVCSCINSHPFVSAPYSSIKVRVNSEEGHADIGHHLVRISRLFWVCCYYVHILKNAVVTLRGKQFCKPHMSCRV